MRHPTIRLVDDATLGVWALLDAVTAESDDGAGSVRPRFEHDSGGSWSDSAPQVPVVEFDSGTIRRLRRPAPCAALSSLLGLVPGDAPEAIVRDGVSDGVAGAFRTEWG